MFYNCLRSVNNEFRPVNKSYIQIMPRARSECDAGIGQNLGCRRHRAKPNNVVAQTVLTLGGGRSCITATIFLALLNQSGRFRQTKGWDKIRLIPGVQRHVVLWISWFLLRRAPRKKPSYCPLAVFPGRISGSSPYRHFRGHQEHYCNFTDSPLIR